VVSDGLTMRLFVSEPRAVACRDSAGALAKACQGTEQRLLTYLSARTVSEAEPLALGGRRLDVEVGTRAEEC
jgi:hypothetical protein